MDKQAVIELAKRAEKVVTEQHVEGKVGLFASSDAWSAGRVELKVVTDIPAVITPAEAKQIGWALFMLGKYGLELNSDRDHDIDDEDFFMD